MYVCVRVCVSSPEHLCFNAWSDALCRSAFDIVLIFVVVCFFVLLLFLYFLFLVCASVVFFVVLRFGDFIFRSVFAMRAAVLFVFLFALLFCGLRLVSFGLLCGRLVLFALCLLMFLF